VHCDIWKNRGKEDSPTVEQWKVVLQDLRKWLGPVQVVFSGGEALLRPFTVDLARYASSLGLFLEVLTHGYWDNQSRIEKLALANPWRITVSVDGIGDTHSRIRGREGFWEKTHCTLETLSRMRRENNLGYRILLKTVVMDHNLSDVPEVARFAKEHGFEVFYQAIEQNYNTPQDRNWFEHTDNWPRDIDKAVKQVEELIRLKRAGFPIINSYAQLEVMVPYFRFPASWQAAVQQHAAHERQVSCAALCQLQLQANGNVTICANQGPVNNVKRSPIREIWETRPHLWEHGCCLERPSGSASENTRLTTLLPR
jgi:MoaA/NifB/PqqE/SkfB family radical SAM enzyme